MTMIQSILSHKMPLWLSGGGPEGDVVLSTRVRIARNLEHHRFPRRASPFERAQVYKEIAAAFGAAAGSGLYSAVAFATLDKRQREFLVEEGRASTELASAGGGSGIVHDSAGRVSVLVNEDDHLRLTALDAGIRRRELFAELDALDDAVGACLDYAFDKHVGFLTSCPADAGTGLAVSFLVHFPSLALTRSLDRVLSGIRRKGLGVRGFICSTGAGNLFLMSAGQAAGTGEAGILDNAAALVKQAAWLERKSRERVLADGRDELADRIHHSWDILCRAKGLTVEGFFEHSSALRLGIECNLFDKCTLSDLNRLSLFVQRAHLETCVGRTLAPGEAGEARASLVQTYFARNAQEEPSHENG
jgi:protein arginine kinase